MDAQEPAGAASQPEQDEATEGVFGNLPRTRPGARSPRRNAEEARRPRSRAKQAAEEPSAQEPTASAGSPPPPPDSGGGIEDVAWAGVAAAAEAATISVRLANRALEAMRDAVDRR